MLCTLHSDAVHSRLGVAHRMPSTLRIGCDGGHRMGFHCARWRPLPHRWCAPSFARRAPSVRRCGRCAHYPCGGAGWCAHRRRGLGVGARTSRPAPRARCAAGGHATRRPLHEAGSSEVPISQTPLTAIHPESRMRVMRCAFVWQITVEGSRGGADGHRPVPRPRGAYPLGRSVRTVRAPTMWCAHPGPPMGAPLAPCAHRWCGGRGGWRTTVRTGAAAGSARHGRCGVVRAMPYIVDIGCAHRMPGGLTPPSASALGVGSTPTRWTSRWAPLPTRCTPRWSPLPLSGAPRWAPLSGRRIVGPHIRSRFTPW